MNLRIDPLELGRLNEGIDSGGALVPALLPANVQFFRLRRHRPVCSSLCCCPAVRRNKETNNLYLILCIKFERFDGVEDAKGSNELEMLTSLSPIALQFHRDSVS
jgi:hypothetical protein